MVAAVTLYYILCIKTTWDLINMYSFLNSSNLTGVSHTRFYSINNILETCVLNLLLLLKKCWLSVFWVFLYFLCPETLFGLLVIKVI